MRFRMIWDDMWRLLMADKKFMLDPGKFMVALSTSALSAVIGGAMFFISRPFASIPFLLIAVIFAIVASRMGSSVTVSDECVHARRPLSKDITVDWNDVKELRVVGTNVFSKAKKQKTGSLYILVSQKELTDDECFDITLRWPPKDMIYLSYNTDRINTLQAHFSSKVKTYHTGDISFAD